jgi:hypothetical protein
MQKFNLKKHVADRYSESPLVRLQAAQGKVYINGKVYLIQSNNPDKPLTDLDVLIEDFTLTEFNKGD